MANFAYLDAEGILHVGKEEIARIKIKQGNLVETEFPAKGGFPVDKDGNAYILYSDTQAKNDRDFPAQLAQLYRACKGENEEK